MEILLTGNTCFVTPAWVEMAFPEDHVLITCARGQPHPPRIRTITLDSKERIGQLVDSYEFDRIVYFSEYLTPHSEQEGELDRLRRVLQANRERPSQLLYLAGPEAVLTPFIGKSVLAQAAEALCRHYAETSRVQIKVLHLPYLYGTDCTGAPVGIAQLLTRPKSGELHFEEQALAPVAALCMEDLSELVLRVFDNWTPEWESLTAPVVFHWNYEQLGEAWKALCPGLTVTYGSDLIREYPPDDGQLRRAYGWFPRYDLLDDLPRFFRQEKQPRRKVEDGNREKDRQRLERIASDQHESGEPAVFRGIGEQLPRAHAAQAPAGRPRQQQGKRRGRQEPPSGILFCFQFARLPFNALYSTPGRFGCQFQADVRQIGADFNF